MPHVSRRKLKPTDEKRLFDTLLTVLKKINKDEDMEGFLFSLLSETEKIMLAKRLAAIILIKENLSDMDIADRLCITRETVLRIKAQMQIRGNGHEIALKKLEEEQYLSEFKKFLMSLARYSARAAGGRVKFSILD